MNRVLIAGVSAFLIAGCTQSVAPTVEENANLVKVEPDPVVQFKEPPKREVPPAPVPVENELAPKVRVVMTPTLGTEPPGATRLSELREVWVGVEVLGVDPSELAVEFTAPEGQVYDRQARRLTGTRYDRQLFEFSLPVGGTLISSVALVGTWKARVFHDDLEISVLPFEVTP